MKKYIIAIIACIVIIGVIFFVYFNQSTSQNSSPTPGTRMGTNTQISNNETNHNNNNNINNVNSNTNKNSTNSNTNKKVISETQTKEKEIAKFSTDILVDDNKRDNNLELTASKINNTIVKNGESFSFNDVVGNPTPDKGYKKAGIIVDGKKEKGYGGGNCQISTTLYDAVLKVDGLKVTERHEHGKDVGYVEEGKDATVVYDELDLKFENNTGYDIKIKAEVTSKEVIVRIMKITIV